MNIDQITRAITDGGLGKKPILIGIEGYGGSGKTTFANSLKKVLSDTCVISLDDFIIRERLLDSSAEQPGFDRMRLRRQVLSPAESGKPVIYQKYEWTNNALSDSVYIPEVNYLIVEGTSSYHPKIARYYDYKIWVEVPIEVAKQRGRQRDAGNENEQHWDLWSANDLAYQEKYHPEQRADFIYEPSR